MSMHGSAMMYVTAAYSSEGLSGLDHLLRALLQSRFRDDVIEAGGVRAAQSRGVGVVREAEDRHLRIRLDDVVRIDPRNVADDQIGRLDGVGGHEVMPG